jgi:hypothetical protein
MCAFPFHLSGQGFFPGGDGLWRSDSEIAKSTLGTLPRGGAMFVGNDFGTITSYEKLRAKGFENPLTWKHVKERIRRAAIPEDLTFFTNAVMGLRTEGKALDKKDWSKMPLFADFCREFFLFQIEAVKPRLVVVMGPNPRTTLESLAVATTVVNGAFPAVKIGSHNTTIYYSTHPYGDFNFSEKRKAEVGATLSQAWIVATAA